MKQSHIILTESFLNLPGAPFRGSPIVRLAGVDAPVECPYNLVIFRVRLMLRGHTDTYLLHRNGRVWPMGKVDVDIVGLKSLERLVQAFKNTDGRLF